MRARIIAAVCGLMLSGLFVAAGPAAAADPLGTVTARDQKLQRGCHSYPFTYRVSPPPFTSTWLAEIFLIGPNGRKVASAGFLSPADPTQGKSAWRLCRRSIVAGKYTMRMKVTFIEIYDADISWVKPTTFRLTRR